MSLKIKLKPDYMTKVGRRGVAATSRSGVEYLRREPIYEPVREVKAWLDAHAPGWSVVKNTIRFADPNAAFHFKMRWG